MKELPGGYEITRRDVAKEKMLRVGAIATPVVTAAVPAVVFFLLFLISPEPASKVVFFTLALAGLIGGFVFGLLVSGGLLYYRSRWLADVRERIAYDGIRADELDWFRHELSAAERRSLKEIEGRNLLLGDAFRDSLAARLTATRILKSAKQELSLVKRRQNKLKYSKAENSAQFQEELQKDLDKLTSIHDEADAMRLEAENRMHQIETASRHGSNFSETELALKKLSARTSELPLALESARMEEEIRKELEAEN